MKPEQWVDCSKIYYHNMKRTSLQKRKGMIDLFSSTCRDWVVIDVIQIHLKDSVIAEQNGT